jgi:chromosome partitioning protein
MFIIIGGNDMNKNIISFLNMKGGVCKTTLCKEIALYLSNNMNKKVLVIDIDPQANCTQSFFEHFKVIQIKDDEIITDIKKSDDRKYGRR